MYAALAQAQEQTEEHASALAVDPIYMGIGAFVFLAALLIVTLAIGKGRPHA